MTDSALIERQTLSELNTLRDGPAALRLLSHLLLISAGGVVWAQQLWPLPLRLAGLLLCGMGLATCFAGLHECSHRTAFRSRRVNDAAAWLLGLLSFYNATAYRRYHQWHHRYTHQPGLDPELDDPQPTSLPAYLLELSGWNWWSGKLRAYATLLWGDLSAVPYLNAQVIPQVRRSAWLQVGVYLLLAAVSLIDGNGFLLWFWLLPLLVGQPFLRFVLLAEHSGCSFSADGTANTRTTLTTASVRWLMWNMPFHAEHHLYPSLPFHALPAAHELIGPHLLHLDQGYLRVHRQLLANLPALALPAGSGAA
ncbi:fatty acid desaturase [Synechococcus sp. GFB01]|uniref:fatty acid desaturase n=1 Tax=Synechococcus sp. GFB01 TaxID=1662190 RepID=UPI00064E9C6E|nr:fatty acid desaturase [Synechococcus sp. GFB01]KMM17604.1 fatty acid desaturase [Synechococcus sp. GFB01]